MKLHQVRAAGAILRWAGSADACRKAKKEIVAGSGVEPSAISYEEAEVPTSKAGLLEFLNKNCVAKS